MATMMIHAPVDAAQVYTPEQRRANFQTHAWYHFGDEPAECDRCCARTYHQAAEYPCGVEPARITMEVTR